MATKQRVIKVMYWLNMGCYPGLVLFSCGFNYKEIIALLKKKKAKEWRTGLSQKTDRDMISEGGYFAFRREVIRSCDNKKKKPDVKNLFYIIITEPFMFSDYEYCKLAHEVLHVCQFYLPDVLDRTKEMESEAYLHTHVMKQCLEKLRG